MWSRAGMRCCHPNSGHSHLAMAAVPKCGCGCTLRGEEVERGMCIACHNICEEELRPYTAIADADDMIVSVGYDAVRFEDLGFQFFDEVPRTLVDADSIQVPAQFCHEPATPAGPPTFVKVCDKSKALVKMTPTFAVVICSAGRPKHLEKTLRLVVDGLKDGGISTSVCVLVDPADEQIEEYKELGGKPTGNKN